MNRLDIKKIDNNKYNVLLQVPLEYKWYEDVYINCFNSKDYFSFKLEHKDNDNNIIKFDRIIELPDSALYNTFISCKIDGEDYYLDKDNNFTKNIDKTKMRKISVNFNLPDWCKGSIIYHIFVDRFKRSNTNKLIEKPNKIIHYNLEESPLIGPDNNGIWNNDFYGGDIEGIIEKLDYIRGLGVSIIYLSPIWESQSNHRYDTGDYLKVDSYLGSNLDLKRLCDKAHSMGIKIILDGVFNHTGNDSIYYNEYNNYDSDGAYHNRGSYYDKFYKKKNGDFQYWWGFKNLPECDCESYEWQEFVCGKDGVIDKWFSYGIDGLRLDVADELTDHFIELVRDACERNKKDSFIYGEVWEQPIYKKRDYIMSGHGMHSIMNYKGMDALIRYYNYGDVDFLRKVINEILGEYPKEVRDSLMNSTSTHDISRIITILGKPSLYDSSNDWSWDFDNFNHEFIREFALNEGEYSWGKEKYMSYLLALSFLPGNFTIFYGDEAGIQGLGNLDNRKYFPWNRIDSNINDVVKDIGRIKNNNSFLKDADINILDINDKYFMYERYDSNNKLLVCTSRTWEDVDLKVPNEYKEKVYVLNRSNENRLNRYGGIIMRGE